MTTAIATRIRRMTFAEKLRLHMRIRDFTYRRLADELNGMVVYGRTVSTSKSTVDNWAKGKYPPDLYEVIALSKVFGVSIDYLLLDEVEETRNDVLSEDQRLLLRVLKTAGMSADEALAKIMRSSPPSGPKNHGTVAAVNATEQLEARAAKVRPPKKK